MEKNIERKYKDCAKLITVGAAISAHKAGIYIAVSNGRDVIVGLEKKP